MEAQLKVVKLDALVYLIWKSHPRSQSRAHWPWMLLHFSGALHNAFRSFCLGLVGIRRRDIHVLSTPVHVPCLKEVCLVLARLLWNLAWLWLDRSPSSEGVESSYLNLNEVYIVVLGCAIFIWSFRTKMFISEGLSSSLRLITIYCSYPSGKSYTSCRIEGCCQHKPDFRAFQTLVWFRVLEFQKLSMIESETEFVRSNLRICFFTRKFQNMFSKSENPQIRKFDDDYNFSVFVRWWNRPVLKFCF